MANKPLKFVEHEIQDNIILTNKKPSELNKHTVLIGASKVTVGVNQENKVIKVDPVTGLNYLDNQTDAQQIYNLSTQRRGNYFALAIETGRGGKSWYPGSKKVATTIAEDVEVKEEPSETSTTLITIPESTTIKIVDEGYEDSGLGIVYDLINYNSVEGYVKTTCLTNKRYVDREE